MVHRRSRRSAGHSFPVWPVLLLLLLVLVPTVCLLWFMDAAIQSHSFAVRQTLSDVYSSQLAMLRRRLDDHWSQRANTLDARRADSAAFAFANTIEAGVADSVIYYDERGRPIYPASTVPTGGDATESGEAWTQASHLEFIQRDSQAAAESYRKIAEQSSDDNEAAKAFVAEARCLVRAGRTAAALQILTETLSQDRYERAVDSRGRLIVADAEFRALELIGEPQHPDYAAVVERLERRLNDYDNLVLPAAQRRFLMKQVAARASWVSFPTLAAEDLAARFLDVDLSAPTSSVLLPTALSDVWQFASPDSRMRALFRTETLLANTRGLFAEASLPTGVDVQLVVPDGGQNQDEFFVSAPAGERLPGWTLAIVLKEADVLGDAARERTAGYWWTGLLAIAAVVVLAVLIAGAFRRQLRVTRLRNDLVATVSHELKTPLSSSRLLVDTLLDTKQLNEKTTREYLQLIAKENMRLSRLIDNFLAFSRMERNKHAFEFAPTKPEDIVKAAAETLDERVRSRGYHLEVQIAENLPLILADADAMVTVLLNLLDNACKYSADDKRVSLRVQSDDGVVRFEVQDRGIGLSRAASKKVFRRFYQVDQRLSRQGGGCGLGLSIVQFVVNAHGGNVRVSSQLGQGSTFTVTIPCAADQTPLSKETAT